MRYVDSPAALASWLDPQALDLPPDALAWTQEAAGGREGKGGRKGQEAAGEGYGPRRHSVG